MAPVAIQTLGVGEIFPPRSDLARLARLASTQLPGERTAGRCLPTQRVEGCTRESIHLIKSSLISVINQRVCYHYYYLAFWVISSNVKSEVCFGEFHLGIDDPPGSTCGFRQVDQTG